MARLYLLLFVISLIGGVGYAAYGYYTSTQQRIQTLAENNAKLEVAIEKSEKSINLLKTEADKNAKLSKELQQKLEELQSDYSSFTYHINRSKNKYGVSFLFWVSSTQKQMGS